MITIRHTLILPPSALEKPLSLAPILLQLALILASLSFILGLATPVLLLVAPSPFRSGSDHNLLLAKDAIVASARDDFLVRVLGPVAVFFSSLGDGVAVRDPPGSSAHVAVAGLTE